METPKKVQYRAKFDSIFQQIGKATNSIWKGEEWSDYVDALNYKTNLLGQNANVKIEFVKDKVKALFLVGNYYTYRRYSFSKEITFSVNKDESKILKDFLERLEVKALEEKIKNILNAYKEMEEKENLERFRIEAFRRVLPFDKKAYNGKYSAYMDGVTVLFEPYTNLLEIKGNSEMALKICGKIAELLNQ
ncbi:hypothetical protein [Haemophilus sp. SZY H52]|uniref:hypothetical protein n=1 Tax=Haemophilus sp. SZY H52 TaxID=3042471 RepID=UPI0035131AA4